MSDAEKLQKIKESFEWCLENEKECLDTKHESQSTSDNWDKIKTDLMRIFNF